MYQFLTPQEKQREDVQELLERARQWFEKNRPELYQKLQESRLGQFQLQNQLESHAERGLRLKEAMEKRRKSPKYQEKRLNQLIFADPPA